MTPLQFVTESNAIEGISRPPTQAEMDEYGRFMALDEVTPAELGRFVGVYQPGAVLRDKPGLDVRVGAHHPPKGGLHILTDLVDLLDDMEDAKAYYTHLAYEYLHPFTDGNGRSGRMLWMWQMRSAPLGFLHHFYYQTLGAQ